MFHRFRFLCLPLLCMGMALAGPDDDYIAVYRTLSNADAEQIQGHLRDARRNYQEARERLLALHRAYPNWNEKVVGFRLRYIEEKLTQLGPDEPGSPNAPPPPASASPATPSVAPEGEVLDQFNRLNQQIGELTRDRKVLEAKLREALSAQPAPIDPRELQQAVEKISSLQSTNQVLSAQLERQMAERKNLVEKVVADEAREALNEANRQLMTQRNVLASLTRERSELDAELKRLRDGELKGLKTENTALKSQVSELKSDTERGPQIAELSGKLSALQARFEAAEKENAGLLADKARLEKQIEDFRSRQTEETSVRIRKLETDLTVARADQGRQAARVEQLTLELEKESGKASSLQTENLSLSNRVVTLAGQLAASQKAEAALVAERMHRQELEAQLKTAEQRLSVASEPDGRGPTDDGTPADAAAAAAAKASQVEILDAEVKRLRESLQSGRERESRLLALLAEADRQRQLWNNEKADLLARLQQMERSSGRDSGGASSPNYQRLVVRVRELETQRDELTRKLAEASVRVDVEGSIIRDVPPVTPREQAVEFRLKRAL